MGTAISGAREASTFNLPVAGKMRKAVEHIKNKVFCFFALVFNLSGQLVKFVGHCDTSLIF
jgi:hypothetical protein